MPTRAGVIIAFALSLVGVGCRDVRLAPDDDGSVGGGASSGDSTNAGKGSATGATGQSTSSAQGGTTASSTSTGPVDELCDGFCSAVGGCMNNCHGACLGYQSAPCEAEGVAVVDCLTALYDEATCGPPEGGCANELSTFLACRASEPQGCMGWSGGGGPDSCFFLATCTAGEEQVICGAEGEGMACTCFLNAIPVSTCEASVDPGPMGVPAGCDPVTSCCHFGTWP